jgi:hypothetical protein
MGRDAVSVWGHPRRRDEAARDPRASIEAGTRRTHVRWEPTHGYQRDQPSCLTGSASSDGSVKKWEHVMKHMCPLKVASPPRAGQLSLDAKVAA